MTLKHEKTHRQPSRAFFAFAGLVASFSLIGCFDITPEPEPEQELPSALRGKILLLGSAGAPTEKEAEQIRDSRRRVLNAEAAQTPARHPVETLQRKGPVPQQRAALADQLSSILKKKQAADNSINAKLTDQNEPPKTEESSKLQWRSGELILTYDDNILDRDALSKKVRQLGNDSDLSPVSATIGPKPPCFRL